MIDDAEDVLDHDGLLLVLNHEFAVSHNKARTIGKQALRLPICSSIVNEMLQSTLNTMLKLV